MRKALVSVSFLIIILAVLVNMVLPNMISYSLKNYLKTVIQAEDIQGDIETHPAFMFLAGNIDKIDYNIKQATIGQVEVHDIRLQAEDINIDLVALFRHKLELNKVGKINLQGTINSAALKNLLVKKISKVRDVSVDITPQNIQMKAAIPLLGSSISANMVGSLYARDGDVYLSIHDIKVENTILGKINLNNMEAIRLINKDNLPLDLHIDSIRQTSGQIVIKASSTAQK